MEIQRANTKGIRQSLYNGVGTLLLVPYFAQLSRLETVAVRYQLEPGSSEGLHLHAANAEDSCTYDAADEIYLVLSGELVMTVDGQRESLAAGDAAYARAGSLHGIANESDGSAELLVLYGPPAPKRESGRT